MRNGGSSGPQGHPAIYREFEVIQGYMRPAQNRKLKEHNKIPQIKNE